MTTEASYHPIVCLDVQESGKNQDDAMEIVREVLYEASEAAANAAHLDMAVWTV
jgi:hypothetical protein